MADTPDAGAPYTIRCGVCGRRWIDAWSGGFELDCPSCVLAVGDPNAVVVQCSAWWMPSVSETGNGRIISRQPHEGSSGVRAAEKGTLA